MIVLTRLNGSTFAVNPDLIERIQENPDTSIVLVDGTTFIVLESTEDIIEAVATYRARVIALAHSFNFDGPSSSPRTGPRLGLVDNNQFGGSRKGAR